MQVRSRQGGNEAFNLAGAGVDTRFHVKRRSLCDACGRSAVRDRGYGSEESSCNQGSIWFHVKQRRDTE